MDWKLELVVVPVSDMDRAKDFYTERIGFDAYVDHSAGEDFRVIQLLPTGSGCAIALMKNPSAAGSLDGLHLVVADIDAARAELVGRGADVGEPYHFGPTGQTAGPDPSRSAYNTFFSFSDPDGNGWLVQQGPQTAAADTNAGG